MKVLFIHTVYLPDVHGGAELILQALAEGLAEQGVEVVVLATSAQSGLHKDDVNGIRVWRAGLRNVYWHFASAREPVLRRRIWHGLDVYNPLMTAYVRRVVEMERPDVASCHNLPGWSVSAWQALAAHDVPTVQVLHDHYLLCPATSMFKDGHACRQQCASCHLMRLPHARMSRQLAGVIGVSHFILDRHRAMGYFAGVPVQRVIHNARSPETLGLPMPRRDARDESRPLRFGFIGALTPAKGIEMLLHAFTAHPIRHAELWIGGDGYVQYEDELKRRYRSDTIRFLGRVQPRDFYPEVDVVVVPSQMQDTFPGVVAEALAFGRPVIGTRRGGIPEMIEDGVNGLLIDAERPQELVQAMRRLADEPQLRARMSAEARVSAAPFLDTRRFLREHAAVYRTVHEQAVRRRTAQHPIRGDVDPLM